MGTTMVAIKGGGLVEKAVADLLRYTKRTVKGPVLKVSPNASNAKKIMVFNVGRSKNLKGKGAEYARQIQRQIDGLNKMSAKQILDNLNAFDAAKRAGRKTRNASAARAARRNVATQMYSAEYRAAIRSGSTKVEAANIASLRTNSQMRSLALLHEPDAVVGGADKFGKSPSLGDTSVNCSLGPQMGNMSAEVRAHVEQMVRTGQGGASPQLAWILGRGR